MYSVFTSMPNIIVLVRYLVQTQVQLVWLIHNFEHNSPSVRDNDLSLPCWAADDAIFDDGTSSLILSTRSCLAQFLNASASLWYVAAVPFLCLHILSICNLWAGTKKGAYLVMFASSCCVSPSAGATSFHSAMSCDIWYKCSSEHSFHSDMST